MLKLLLSWSPARPQSFYLDIGVSKGDLTWQLKVSIQSTIKLPHTHMQSLNQCVEVLMELKTKDATIVFHLEGLRSYL